MPTVSRRIIEPYLPFEEFIAENPVLNRSSRVYDDEGDDDGGGPVDPGGTVHTLSVSDGTVVTVGGGGTVSILVSPTTLAFPDTQFQDVPGDPEVAPGAPLEVTVTSTGGLPAVVSALPVTGPFSLVGPPALPAILAVGASLVLSVRFSPVAGGAATGHLEVTSDAAGGTVEVDLSGTGIPRSSVSLSILSTSGNQIVRHGTTSPVRLRSVNWFGAEGTNYTPHGTWSRPYKVMIDQFVSWGFNCLRLPFSGDIVTPGRMPSSINTFANPDLDGLTALEVIDKILDYCAEKLVYVVLDHHRRQAGAGADGSPVGSGYDLAAWHATWTTMANRYKNHPAVAGADLHNEPHDLEWGVWAGYAEGCAAVINGIAPSWLIFVEGVGAFEGESYWWGGQLKGVGTRPVVIPQAAKLVYSPHEYGQSVAAGQPWLDYEGSAPPSGWPDNLRTKWDDVWGFIFFDGIAPIWIGEFGGKFGYDGSGNDMSTPHRDEERTWLAELSAYMNGDKDGDGNPDDIGVAGGLGMSFAFWSLNPNSADTGGLLEDDWTAAQEGKLTLLSSLLSSGG